jgi:hypothetical protein
VATARLKIVVSPVRVRVSPYGPGQGHPARDRDVAPTVQVRVSPSCCCSRRSRRLDVGGGDSAKHVVSASQDAPTLTALGCPPEADLVVTTANVQTRVNEPVGFYVAVLA